MVDLSPGDIIKVNLSPVVGHEQVGYRPAIVLSLTDYNKKTSMVVIAPITNNIRGYSTEVVLPVSMTTTGCIRMDQVCTLDLGSRAWTQTETAPAFVLEQCQNFVRVILGLSPKN